MAPRRPLAERFFEGTPCFRCSGTLRYTGGGTCVSCACYRANERREGRVKPRVNGTSWLFEDDAAEYHWLVEQGFTHQEMAERSGVKMASLERALYRKGLA